MCLLGCWYISLTHGDDGGSSQFRAIEAMTPSLASRAVGKGEDELSHQNFAPKSIRKFTASRVIFVPAVQV
jgi:hypothetical protein